MLVATLAVLSLLQTQEPTVAARINDEVVTWDEIDLLIASSNPSEVTPDLRRSMLRQAVQERLFLQKAKALEIRVSEEEIDNRIEYIKRNGSFGKPDDPRELVEKRFNEYLAYKHKT